VVVTNIERAEEAVLACRQEMLKARAGAGTDRFAR